MFFKFFVIRNRLLNLVRYQGKRVLVILALHVLKDKTKHLLVLYSDRSWHRYFFYL